MKLVKLLLLASLVCVAGCPDGRGPDHPRGASEAGLSLTYYADRKQSPEDTDVKRILVVEQRRWVDVGADKTLDIDQIDEGADLESLVIESLSNPGGLKLGGCSRDLVSIRGGASTAWVGRKAVITVGRGRSAEGTITSVRDGQLILASDDGRVTAVTLQEAKSFTLIGGDAQVRCQVESGTGKQLVRVVYTTPGLTFSSEHTMVVRLDDVGVGTAEITPRFTVYTPAWQVVADVALYDGIPGGAHPPHEVFRGPVTLTGDPVIVAGEVIKAPARLDAVYRGAVVSPGEPARDQYWRNGMTMDVWEWLELDLGDDTMPPGRVMLEVNQTGEPVPQPAMVEADAIELVNPETDRSGQIRIKLWPSVDLRGMRMKYPLSVLDNGLTESLLFSVSNGGDRPREILIEEELRPGKKREVMKPFPTKPTVRNGVLRVRVTARPGRAVRVGYVMSYEW
jgi:hypothetical protein